MDEEKSHEGMSRRELVQSMAVLGLLGASGSLLAGAAPAMDTGPNPNYEHLRKVLVERLVNTRYYPTQDGNVVVMLNDEIWPGDEGGAHHQDWLFNPVGGLKDDPRTALEDTVGVANNEHEGIPLGCNLDDVNSALDTCKQLGLLDDVNLVYQVLREKIHIETHGAQDGGVRKFLEWVGQSNEFTNTQKDLISDVVVEYLALPRPQIDHNFY